MTVKSDKAAEMAEAIDTLREILPPGATVYTVLRHVSASGMTRRIDLYSIQDGDMRWLSGYAKTALGYPRTKFDAITVGGWGMDMGYHLVHNLSRTLNTGGFGCVGDNCPSNDHSNGDRDYTPHMNGAPNTFSPGYVGHWHSDGGYALRHRWI
jgi:hypothetical protein